MRRPLQNLSFTQSIVDTVREPLLVLDGTLRIRSANRSFFEQFHVSPEHTQGILIYELGNRQWDIPALRKLLEEVLPHNTVMTDFLVEHDFPVIGQKAMLLNARKLRYEEEDLILLAIEDITDRRHFEIEQEHFMHELANRNEGLAQFAQVAGHDLRTPLSAIAGFVHILQRRYTGQLDAGFDEFLGRMVESTKSMADLLSDLLQYAQAGEVSGPATHKANAEQVLDTVLGNLQPVINANNAVVTHDPLPSVSIDPTSLTQLLQNLIVNGIQYRRAGEVPRIHVSARQDREDFCLFSVSDNGIGIQAEHRKNIFAPFRRLHGDERPGTGLGLAITQRIVERYGGDIWVESQPGKGSVFYFTIPCLDSAFLSQPSVD